MRECWLLLYINCILIRLYVYKGNNSPRVLILIFVTGPFRREESIVLSSKVTTVDGLILLTVYELSGGWTTRSYHSPLMVENLTKVSKCMGLFELSKYGFHSTLTLLVVT